MAVSPFVSDVRSQDFRERVLEASHRQPVLVDFWATWCAPCRLLMPLLAKLADDYKGRFLLAKINTEQEQALAMQFGIRSIPHVKLFHRGQMVDEFMGALPESGVRAFLARHLPEERDILTPEIDRVLASGDVTAMEHLLERLRAENTEHPHLPLLMAGWQARQGDFESAESALGALPLDRQNQPEVKALRARLLLWRAMAQDPDIEALERVLRDSPNDPSTLYALAAHHALAGRHETSLELLFTLFRQQRNFQKGAPRKAILAILDLLGDDARVPRYRSRLASLMY
ncbi:putative thioredoxin [Gammaproteobacteria bacterium]